MNSSKLSGAAVRKRKRQRDEENRKMSGRVLTFVQRVNPSSRPMSDNGKQDCASGVSTAVSQSELSETQQPTGPSASCSSSSTPNDFVVHHDLGLISTVNDSIRCTVARLDAEWFRNSAGPFAQKSRPGQDLKGAQRSLSRDWFTIRLPNGELVERQWMCYSPSKGALLCLPCMLFSQDSASKFSMESRGIFKEVP